MPLAFVLAPLYLPVLHIVTLLTVPATALYALFGLVTAPVVLPALILRNAINVLIFAPFLLMALPLSIPVGICIGSTIFFCHLAKSLFIVFTPLLWPVYWFIKVWNMTFIVAKVMVTDTIAPWLVPLRFTFLAALAPAKAAFSS